MRLIYETRTHSNAPTVTGPPLNEDIEGDEDDDEEEEEEEEEEGEYESGSASEMNDTELEADDYENRIQEYVYLPMPSSPLPTSGFQIEDSIRGRLPRQNAVIYRGRDGTASYGNDRNDRYFRRAWIDRTPRDHDFGLNVDLTDAVRRSGVDEASSSIPGRRPPYPSPVRVGTNSADTTSTLPANFAMDDRDYRGSYNADHLEEILEELRRTDPNSLRWGALRRNALAEFAFAVGDRRTPPLYSREEFARRERGRMY